MPHSDRTRGPSALALTYLGWLGLWVALNSSGFVINGPFLDKAS